jgi:hypothetical protein
MKLREIKYQMSLRLKSLLPVFHKSHYENLIWMVVGMVYSRSVMLPWVAEHAPVGQIQLESRVERFERLLRCAKLEPLEVLKPVASKVLTYLSRFGPLMILIDRTMINDTLNLLYVAVSFGGRALPLGWVVVPHEGNSNLALQQQLLTWLRECLPARAEVYIVADREFHSIHLARWIRTQMKVHFVLRIKAGTWVRINGRWRKAGSLAVRGQSRFCSSVRVTRDPRVAEYEVNLLALWSSTEDEPWLLISDAQDPPLIESIYRHRFWIEEMFSDHKSRGLNLEATRITDPDRLQRLLVAATLAYLWIMEVGAVVVARGWWRQVDNRGAQRSVSLCQIGLRWVRDRLNQALAPLFFTGHFIPLEES